MVDILMSIYRSRKVTDIVVLEVYSGLSMVMADAASLFCKLLRLPVIGVLHGGNLPAFSVKYPNWTKRVFKRLTRIVAPSAFLADGLQLFGFDIQVIPNIISFRDYPFRQRGKIGPQLIWMRSFHPIYDPEMALEVIAKLRESHSDASLVMAGPDKGQEAQVRRKADQMGLSKAVRFPGFLDQRAKISELGRADIFINTTRTDNMPVSVVEACAMGIPVVATRVGGIERLLTDGENALLVDEGDANGMSLAIEKLLRDEALTNMISANARSLAEMSSWDRVHRQWRTLFSELLADGHPAENEVVGDSSGHVADAL